MTKHRLKQGSFSLAGWLKHVKLLALSLSLSAQIVTFASSRLLPCPGCYGCVAITLDIVFTMLVMLKCYYLGSLEHDLCCFATGLLWKLHDNLDDFSFYSAAVDVTGAKPASNIN